jgi:hypothetical protein
VLRLRPRAARGRPDGSFGRKLGGRLSEELLRLRQQCDSGPLLWQMRAPAHVVRSKIVHHLIEE